MSGIIKNALKFSVLRSAGSSLLLKELNGNSQFHRRLWHMSSGNTGSPQILHHSFGFNRKCGCDCGTMKMHTKGDCLRSKAALPRIADITPGERELADFLNEEIAAERKLQKSKNIPSELDGFKVKLDGSEVSLIKKSDDEIIEVNFNINHSVDMDTEPEVDPSMDKPELGEMKSRPNFEVEIKRGGKTLGFTCSIVSPSATSNQQQETGYNDLFAIDEVVMYEGEWKESNYSVSGDVIDGTLYDLLMNLLEDKGISNEFIEKITEFSTSYEHNNYIDLLENVQKFVAQK